MANSENVIEVTTDNIKSLLSGDTPIVLDFWAPWCGPCRMIGPALDALAEQYGGRVLVGKVNVDEQQELGASFNVRSIPMVVALSGGKVVDVQVGFRGRGPLAQMFAKLSPGQASASAN